MIFETLRLEVRKFETSDLDNFHTMQSNPNVMKYIKPVLSYEESVAELEKFIGLYSDQEKFYNLWAVITKSNEKFVGLCGVYLNQQGEYEIAYRLTESAWGNSYGDEIAKGLFSYSLTDLNLPEIVAYAYKVNIPSIKILERHMKFVNESIHDKTGIVGRKYKLSKNNKMNQLFIESTH